MFLFEALGFGCLRVLLVGWLIGCGILLSFFVYLFWVVAYLLFGGFVVVVVGFPLFFTVSWLIRHI